MADDGQIRTAQNLSVVTRTGDGNPDIWSGGMGAAVLWWLAAGGEIVAPWWSRQRDKDLRTFWKKSDHLSGAIFALQAKISTLPFRISPRDATIKAHHKQAEVFTELLTGTAEMGKGWAAMLDPFIEDLLTQDNGGFLEVVGEGQPDGPILGFPLTVRHLDGAQCTRTSDPLFPVVYTQPKTGRKFKLHRTRVIALSQMPSASEVMNGVGFCAVSRAINIAQNLIDIGIYKQEKLGSRPARQILLGKGISTQQIIDSMRVAAEQMDNEGFRTFAKTVALGDPKRTDVDLVLIDLASAPDGFDEQTAITLGMYTLALAFGVDARELWPATASGATKADAMLQHLKARAKGFGQLISAIEYAFNTKVLPPHLRFEFDYQDDEQDQQTAEIREKRSTTHERNLRAQAVSVRTVRERMLDDGDLTDAQFEALELEDGRLEDGTDVTILFYDPAFRDLLTLPVEDPLAAEENDPQTVLAAIQAQVREVLAHLAKLSANSRAGLSVAREQHRARQALAALRALERLYQGEQERLNLEAQGVMQVGGEPFIPPPLSQPGQVTTKEAATSTDPFGGGMIHKDLNAYRSALRSAIRGLWTGALTRIEFEDFMFTALFRRYTEAWAEGASACGITPADYTEAERLRLEQMIYEDAGHIFGLADAIEATNRAAGGTLGPFFSRAELWVNRYNAVMAEAQTMACADQKLAWRLGPTREHCSSCLKLNGKVKRASQWQAAGIRPQSRELECGGWRCLCKFEVTTEPISKGPLPKITKEVAHVRISA